MVKAQLIFNPKAGQLDMRRALRDVLTYLENADWQIDLRETGAPGDAIKYARAAASNYEVVLAMGGDGTISEVANGLALSETALAVLPVGTGNVWAREMGIPFTVPMLPHHLVEAAEIAVLGRRYCVDLGSVNERYFLLWAGAGLDALVTEAISPKVKKTFGPLSYIVAALKSAGELMGTRTSIILDGRKMSYDAILVLVCNIQLYAAVARIAPIAKLDDGLLDVCVYEGGGAWNILKHVFSTVTGQHIRSPEMVYYQAKEVVIETLRPTPVQLDGDLYGTTPIHIKVVPQALRVIAPHKLSHKLFIDS